MGFQSSDKTNSASAGSRVNRANAELSKETLMDTPVETIDSLIVQPVRSSMGAVLPPFENESFMSQRHEVNPAIALNLLGDIQQKVTAWQEQLRQLARAIHAITVQGPMVKGWLESSLASQNGFSEFSKAGSTGSNSAEASLLRHGDADALMQYVDALESRGQEEGGQEEGGQEGAQEGPQSSAAGTYLSSGRHCADGDYRTEGAIAQYRLCSLRDDGSVQSQPCPPEQMALVSTAIARYQKFKQLVAQKDALESKLQLTVDDLTSIRARLQQD